MKKPLLIVLSLAMLLTLCACAGGEQNAEVPNASTAPEETVMPEDTALTKEELIEQAISFTREDLDKAMSNKAFASSFIGNTYAFQAEVYNIEQEYAVLAFRIEDEEGVITWGGDSLCANAYLPLDELVSLELGQRLNVVGSVSEIVDTSMTAFGEVWEGSAIVFDNAFITQDYYETVGQLHSKNNSYEGAWNIRIGDSSYLKLIYFADEVDLSKYDISKEITFKSKIVDGKYIDATIIE